MFVLLLQPPPALHLANFKGCIELDSLNEEVLSLYNFESIIALNTAEEKPCGRSVWRCEVFHVKELHLTVLCLNPGTKVEARTD